MTDASNGNNTRNGLKDIMRCWLIPMGGRAKSYSRGVDRYSSHDMLADSEGGQVSGWLGGCRFRFRGLSVWRVVVNSKPFHLLTERKQTQEQLELASGSVNYMYITK